MKSAKSLVTLLAITVGFYSCKKTINCETPVIKKVLFYSSLSTQTVPDTAATLVKYNKGSNFSQVSEILPPIQLLKKDVYNKTMEFPLDGEETYDYDWKITLLPTMKVYYLSDISHESATSKTHHCTNTVTYKQTDGLVTDSLVTVPGNPYSTTPYYSADIQIEYW